MTDAQRHLPQPHLISVLNIAPEISAARKQTNRDRYERDMPLLTRVRESYGRQTQHAGWHLIAASSSPSTVRRSVGSS